MQKKRTVIKYLLICLPIFLACNIPQASVAYTHNDFIKNLKKYKVIEPDCDGTMEKCKKFKKHPRLWDTEYFDSNKRLLECLTQKIPAAKTNLFSTCNKDDIRPNIRDIAIQLFSDIETLCDINAKNLVGSYEIDSKNDVKYNDPMAPTESGLPIIFNDSTCKDPLYAIISYRDLQTMLPVTYGILLANTGSGAIKNTYIDPITKNLKQGYLGKEYLTQINWNSNCSDHDLSILDDDAPLNTAANNIFPSDTDFFIDRPSNLFIFPGLLLAEHRGNQESIPGMLEYHGNGRVSPKSDRFKATRDSAIELAQDLKNYKACANLSVYVIALPTTDYKEGSLDKDILGGVILYGPAE